MINSENGEGFDITEVKRKAVIGSFTLFVRQGVVHFINIVGNIVIARILIPEDFGTYAIVSFFVNFLVLFGDVGLGSSLIQRTNEPTINEMRSVFTFQQLLLTFIFTIVFILAPRIVLKLHLNINVILMIRLMILTMVFVSFRSISAALLIRGMNFTKIAVVEICESFIFQATTITFAVLGYRAWSFIIGAVLKSLIGSVILYLVAPWPIGIKWDWDNVKAVIKFGIPYQGISIVGLIRDSINPILIGTLLGSRAVGLVSWANMLATYPIIVAGNFNRLFFPTFSRLKDEKEALRETLVKVVRWNNLIVLALLAILISQAHEITEVVFGAKWLPALTLVYCFAFGDLFIVSIPFMALLNALGKPQLTFIFTMVWMASIWIIGYPLIKIFGLLGYGIAHIFVQITNFVLIWKIKQLVKINIVSALSPSMISFFIAVLLTFTIKAIINKTTIITVILLSLTTLVIYICTALIFHGKVLLKEGRSLMKMALQPQK